MLRLLIGNQNLNFVLFFIWDEEKEMYKSYNRCFFEKEEAENFIKEMQND